MANSNAPMFIQTIRNAAVQIDNADSTDAQALIAAGANGTKVESITVSSTDTDAHVLQLFINDGTNNHLLSEIAIPASSGNTSSAPAVSVLQSAQISGSLPYDSNGNRYIYLANGWSLQVAVTVAVTSDDIVDVVATGGDF